MALSRMKPSSNFCVKFKKNLTWSLCQRVVSVKAARLCGFFTIPLLNELCLQSAQSLCCLTTCLVRAVLPRHSSTQVISWTFQPGSVESTAPECTKRFTSRSRPHCCASHGSFCEAPCSSALPQLTAEVGYYGSHAFLYDAVVVLCSCPDKQGQRRTQQQCFGTRPQGDCFLEGGARAHLQEELDLCTEGFGCPCLVCISDKGPFRHVPNIACKCVCPLRVCTLIRPVAQRARLTLPSLRRSSPRRFIHSPLARNLARAPARKYTHARERMTP